MKHTQWLLTPLLMVALAGCSTPHGHAGHGGDAGPGMGGGERGMMGGMMGGQGMMGQDMMQGMAMATLTPTQGNTARGMVVFHQMQSQMMVHAHITGVAPNSEHGFHLHDVGNCASTDGTSAGGHFNPGKTAHGPQDAEHHAGDMPSLKADADGVINQKFMLQGVTIKGDANSIDGRSVILHASADDYKTQPTGNSGARIACGVISTHP